MDKHHFSSEENAEACGITHIVTQFINNKLLIINLYMPFFIMIMSL